jgi:hypothetical protein
MEGSMFESSIAFMVNWIIIIFCIIFIYFTIKTIKINQGDSPIMTTSFSKFTYYFLIFFGIFIFVLAIKAILTSVNAISW